MIRLARLMTPAALALALSGCAVKDLDETPPPMGRFLLGYNAVVVPDDVQKGPMSREVSNDAWVGAVRKAMNDRFSRYDGDQYYHIATAVLGYVLAQPGLPVVAAPKSVLIAEVSVLDDANGGALLGGEPKRFTVFEEGAEAIVGSGLSRTAEEQMESLAKNLAKQVQDWMLENKDWFGDPSLMDPATTSPGRPIQPLPPAPGGTQAEPVETPAPQG
jgi:hypothetical protein